MRTWAALLSIAFPVAACGDDDDAAPTTTAAESTTTSEATTTTAPPEPLTVLVTNDDGVAAAGIDALVEALSTDTRLELVVVAPAENQSGSGDSTTPGGAPASEATTRSGRAAVAVAGEPGDAVVHGLDVVLADDPPDLVISGINEGQNLGPIVDLSGTVGAARIAAREGIPALAVSAGLAPEGREPDYDVECRGRAGVARREPRVAVGGLARQHQRAHVPDRRDPGHCGGPHRDRHRHGNPVGMADCASTLTDPPPTSPAFIAGFIAVSEPGLG